MTCPSSAISVLMWNVTGDDFFATMDDAEMVSDGVDVIIDFLASVGVGPEAVSWTLPIWLLLDLVAKSCLWCCCCCCCCDVLGSVLMIGGKTVLLTTFLWLEMLEDLPERKQKYIIRHERENHINESGCVYSTTQWNILFPESRVSKDYSYSQYYE